MDQAGLAARQLGDLPGARGLHEAALDLHRRFAPVSPASGERALILNNLGVVAFFGGELEVARADLDEALALREQVGDVRGQASSRNNLGLVARFSRDLAAARTFMADGLALRRGLKDPWGEAGSHVNLAAVHALAGDLVAARAHLRDATRGFSAVQDPLGLCECLEAGAELARADGRLADAVACCAAALRRRTRLAAPRPALLERAIGGLLAEADHALGAEAREAAWRRGHEAGDELLALP
jgi:tetratricopeptide (TPR) repeat protein